MRRSVAEKRGAEVGHTVVVWWAEQSLHREAVCLSGIGIQCGKRMLKVCSLFNGHLDTRCLRANGVAQGHHIGQGAS